MKIAQQISVFLDDCPEDFSKATQIVAKNKIDFQTVNVAETPDFWELRFVCDKPQKARTLLNKAGFKTAVHPVVLIKSKNEIGSVATIAKILAENEIHFDYLYSTGGEKKNWKYYMLLIETPVPKDALACLKKVLR